VKSSRDLSKIINTETRKNKGRERKEASKREKGKN